jgi:hypothetical protein
MPTTSPPHFLYSFFFLKKEKMGMIFDSYLMHVNRGGGDHVLQKDLMVMPT